MIDEHFPVYLKIMFIINRIQISSLHKFQYIEWVEWISMLNGSQSRM